jgi:hypothetical protein
MVDCYRFEERLYNDGIFSKCKKEQSVDATYIIHLEGNGRLSKINKELQNIHPTDKLWILHNKGYRICHKENIDNPAADLVDCYYEVFRHATEHKYENILILEDDFFFEEDICINDPENIDAISDFLIEKKDADFIYLLGCLPILQIPIGQHRQTLSLGTHACIYSRKCRERILLYNQTKIGDWDVWHNFHTRKYMFHQPICYQLFPQTENQKGWLSNYLPQFIQTILLLYFISPFFQGLRLDRSIYPGYSFFYSFSTWLFYLIGVLVLYIFHRIFMKLYHRK